MKKLNNKGFMLTETLIVATFLVTVLLFIYVQFNNITRTYNTSFKYNTVDGLYNSKNLIKYIESDGLDNLKTAFSSGNVYYINITSCPNDYFSETEYCTVLMKSSNIKTILFTRENLASLKNNLGNFGENMIDFIRYINYEKTDGYRIIVEFKDGTFATLRV